MSSGTWTAIAVANARICSIQGWRAVEAQHVIATAELTDSLAEQSLLETILEANKPAKPAGTEYLHWLLFTPFRYRPVAPGSRFRAMNAPGVFYAADVIRTACAELGYWRWRFLMDCDSLQQLEPRAHTVFSSQAHGRMVDLREAPFNRHQAQWTDPYRYSATQALAEDARLAHIDIIRYQSVRDPQAGGCSAVLSASSFDPKHPIEQQTWQLYVTAQRVVWQREYLNQQYAFEFTTAAWQ